MTSGSFWDSNVWSFLILFSLILLSLLIAHILRRMIKPLRKSLIPASVIAGSLLLIVSSIYKAFSGVSLFDISLFGGNGTRILEILTYHCLGLGFVAMALRKNDKKFDKKRNTEVFNSGVLTVTVYLIQAIVGLITTITFALCGSKLTFKGAGALLCFGFGQGTGQAMNYGSIYENDYGFSGGMSFGLTIAALGFLVAAIGGVIYLNVIRKQGKVKCFNNEEEQEEKLQDFQAEGEIRSTDSIDKMTIQFAIVFGSYLLSYFMMEGLSKLFESLGVNVRSILFGFNFLLGTLLAVLIKTVLNKLTDKKIIHHQYISNYFMNRIGGFMFDIMIVAGIGAIQIDLIKEYWIVLVVLAIVGAISTFLFVRFTCHKLFPDYVYEEYFAMYGMLTGTASTGIILLREIDPKLETPASDNLVYQTLYAIIFGIPMMLMASYCPKSDLATYISLASCVIYCAVLILILFRKQIFKHKVKSK